MKKRFIFVPILPILALLAACGKQEPAASPSGTAMEADAGNAARTTAAVAETSPYPTCPGLLFAEGRQGDARAGSERLFSTQSVSAILDFYAAHLAEDGWILETSVRQGDEHHLQFRQGLRFLRMQVGPSPNPGAATLLQIAWGEPGEGAAIPDAYEPDYEEERFGHSESSMEW